MFEIIVLGFDEIQEVIDAGWPTRIISVIKKSNMPNYGSHHLHLTFDDVHETGTPHITPMAEHLHKVLDFTKDLTDDDRVLVHCLAGISRSTATAIGILIQHGMNYEDAYNHIKKVRPILAPNKLITQYIDEHFGLNGDLLQLVNDKEPFPNLFKLAYQEIEQLKSVNTDE